MTTKSLTYTRIPQKTVNLSKMIQGVLFETQADRFQ